MRKSNSAAKSAPAKSAAKATSAVAQAAAQLAAAPAPAPAAPAVATVALRGGQAVSKVALTGEKYRTSAPHNVQWWGVITKALEGKAEVPVAPLLISETNKDGVPAAFIGYVIRRGYLRSV